MNKSELQLLLMHIIPSNYLPELIPKSCKIEKHMFNNKKYIQLACTWLDKVAVG